MKTGFNTVGATQVIAGNKGARANQETSIQNVQGHQAKLAKVTSQHLVGYNNIHFGNGLGIFKPEMMKNGNVEFALKEIKKAGFKIKNVRTVELSDHTTKLHYAELGQKAKARKKEGDLFLTGIFKRTVKNMQKGKVTTFIVVGNEQEVQRFKDFTGATNYKKRDPKSLRAKIEAREVKRLQKQGKSEAEIEAFRDEFTFVHASDTEKYGKSKEKNYDREIRIHYPDLSKKERRK